MLHVPDQPINPPSYYQDEEMHQCIECGTLSESEFCSNSCFESYMR